MNLSPQVLSPRIPQFSILTPGSSGQKPKDQKVYFQSFSRTEKLIHILPAPKPSTRAPKADSTVWHRDCLSFLSFLPLQAILGWSSKLSTQSPDSLTFKSLNMQGPLTRGAFFSLSLWIQCSLFQFSDVFEKIHQSTSSSVSCHCQSPFSKDPAISLNWTWGPQLTTSRLGLASFPKPLFLPGSHHPPIIQALETSSLPSPQPRSVSPKATSFLSFPMSFKSQTTPTSPKWESCPTHGPYSIEATADWRRPDKGSQSADTS